LIGIHIAHSFILQDVEPKIIELEEVIEKKKIADETRIDQIKISVTIYFVIFWYCNTSLCHGYYAPLGAQQ